jgi:hypothetical protein
MPRPHSFCSQDFFAGESDTNGVKRNTPHPALRYPTVILRLPLLALLAGLATIWVVGPVFAAPTPTPAPSHAPTSVPAAQPKTIEGQVVAINYSTGIMTVEATGAKRFMIKVLPSTNIQACKSASGANCRPGFMSISEIHALSPPKRPKGDIVNVTVSQLGDELRAQTITILL